MSPLATLFVGIASIAAAFVLFWPEGGLVSRWRATRRQGEHVLTEDALKAIHKWETRGEAPTVEAIAGTLHIGTGEAVALLGRMQSVGLVRTGAGGIALTSDGRASALHIIRAHRLWERYLAEETGFAEADWHSRADRQEHRLTPAEADSLAASLGNPVFDPHGDPIPATIADPVRPGGQPLTRVPPGMAARILHLEDEPAAVYAQLLALRLHPGMTVHVLESGPERLRVWAHGDEHVLAPLVAANVSVVPLEQDAVEEASSTTLVDLSIGDQAEVVGIAPGCRGPERRRFLDLGIVPGTVIVPELRSASGDPTAYRIRGALIALRAAQAANIAVTRKAASE